MIKQKKTLKELKRFWNDEEAQGMMEYILMAVAVITIATLVGPKIKEFVQGQAVEISNSIKDFNSEIRK